MTNLNRLTFEDLRQPGKHIESMREIDEKAPVLDKAVIASLQLAKRRNGGHLPQ
jgi:hypothetical protein